MTSYAPWPATAIISSTGHGCSYPLRAPDDPRDPIFLTICYVCQEEAKPGQEHLRNYGGVVCYSCRAFWRRSHQKSRNPNFVCKKAEDCVITVKNRRRCQKCRYNRCLMTGMSPGAVLDEDQKKIRFRKLLSKRQRLEANSLETSEECPDDRDNSDQEDIDPDVIDLSIRSTHPEAGTRNETDRFSEQIKYYQYSEQEPLAEPHPVFLSQYTEPAHNPTFLQSSEEKENPEKISPKLQSIVRSYQIAVSQTKCWKSEEIFSKLNAIQRGEIGIAISTKDVLFLISKMSEVFRHFALMQREFVALDKSDQRKLLSRNTPLFVQLFMGCYLLAQSGHLPHHSKVEGRLSKKVWMNNFLQNMHLEKFNRIINLFSPDADLDQYARLINKLKGLPVLTSTEQKAVMSYVILFDTDTDLNLTNPGDLNDLAEGKTDLYQDAIKTCEDCLDLQTISKTLVEMALFCTQNINWDGNEGEPVNNVFYNSVPNFSMFDSIYTQEEELWIGMQFQLVNEAFRSVSVGEKLINDFLNCTSGISPLPEDHMPIFFKILHERARRVFKIHPEFLAIPDEDQRNMIALNGPLALAMSVIKAENCYNGFEQIQNGCGELDEKIWLENFLPLIENPDQINKMSLAKDPSLPEEIIRQYLCLAKNLNILTMDPELYKLNLLVILTRQVNPMLESSMSNVNERYVTLLKRRIGWMCLHDPSHGSPSEIIQKIFSGFKHLTQMGLIFQGIASKC